MHFFAICIIYDGLVKKKKMSMKIFFAKICQCVVLEAGSMAQWPGVKILLKWIEKASSLEAMLEEVG